MNTKTIVREVIFRQHFLLPGVERLIHLVTSRFRLSKSRSM
ncbi:hypothetical protein ABID21_003832 [Pseudorhizobium tarimense]|uniref:Uncharacterized protein n=1 Tax=Pseudorhizobium tarimense TaxID=1079109 RepID=A0ABV2HB29_9HYPH|nr:hypothetical protein [Pseudorhizobium tarimense]